MPIPPLTTDGVLPEGVHDCTLEEIRERFGQFQRTDRRCHLFERLEQYVREAILSKVVRAIIVDGSFVTDKDSPSDIDLIVISVAILPDILRPFEYNVLSKHHARRQLGFDLFSAAEGDPDVEEFIEFFSQVRKRPGARKGMLRISL